MSDFQDVTSDFFISSLLNRILKPIIFPLCLRNRAAHRGASIQHPMRHDILGVDGKVVIAILFPMSYLSGLSHGLWSRKRRNHWDLVPVTDNQPHHGLRCLIRSNGCSSLKDFRCIAPALSVSLLSLSRCSRLLSSSILFSNWSLLLSLVLQSHTQP